MTQRKTGFFWGKSTKSMNCKLKFCVMHAGRNKRCIYVWRVFAKETGGCVKTASKLMSAERECFCRFAIRRGWESAAIVEAIFIRISLFQISKKLFFLQTVKIYLSCGKSRCGRWFSLIFACNRAACLNCCRFSCIIL